MLKIYLLSLFAFFTVTTGAIAACGGTTITWTGGTNTNWAKNTNWSPANIPDATTEDAVIVNAAKLPTVATVSIGCMTITSGVLSSSNAVTLTINGDYFRNLSSGTLSVAAGDNFVIALAGTTTQSFEAVDPVNTVTISNNSTVNFTQASTIRTALNLTGTTTVLNVNNNLTLSNTTGTLTIPAGVTVNIGAGKTLTMAGNIVVNGTLRLNPGAQIMMAPTKSITVNSGGQLRLEGSSGNIAQITGNGGYYNMAVAGTLYADYFQFNKVGNDLKGISVTGTISAFSNGSIHYINSNGYGLTLGSATVIPATLNNLSFYDDSSFGNTHNINASAFNVSNVTINNWAGIASTTENDPNNRINWGVQAGTLLNVTTNTNTGKPTTPVTAGAAAGEWVIFSFALNQSSTFTDITSLKLTLTGTADTSDIQSIALFAQGATCQTKGAQIGSNQTFSGSPFTTTFTIPANTVRTSSTTPFCVHAYIQTSATAADANTVGVSIASSADVVNSQGYSFGSGPPLSSGLATISGSPNITWTGGNGTNWASSNNWSPKNVPDQTKNCSIGTGTNNLLMNANRACNNVTFLTGGTVNWNSTTFTLNSYGTFIAQSGVTFQNATTSSLIMSGTGNQNMTMTTAWPGNVTINNTGGASSIISVAANSTINGNLTLTSGTLSIGSGVTLTVLGNIVVQTGAVLDIDPGGTLVMANGKSVTVNAGGTLEMVGGASNAMMTSTGTSAAYTVVVNGTIKADKYSFSNLGTTGVTINSGATIDATYKLSNGSFSYPVSSSSTLLRLYKAIPGNAMSGVSFATGGSAATSVTNIYTDASIGAGTLAISSYSGNLSGPTYHNQNTYLINWVGAANKIIITQAATSPANANVGQAGVVMGRYSFKLQDPGSTDANITSLKLTLTGTGAGSYIDAVKIYYDSDCDSAAGTLLGTGTYSGSPGTVTFSSLTGFTINSSLTTPPTRCLYVTYDVSATAPNGTTLGVSIAASSDVVDSQTWGVANTVTFPLTLGTPTTINGTSTTWTGSVSTDWYTAGNWTGGVPTATLTCTINSAARNPVIGSGTASCKTLTVGTGTLSISAGANLQVYGALSNTGTITNAGTITLRDDGVTIANHALSSSTTLANIVVANTLGGAVSISGTLTINGLTMNGASAAAYDFNVGASRTLVLPSGITINGGSLNVSSSGTIQIGNGQTMTVSGGKLWLNGTSEAYPQTLSTKAKITVQTAGTWNFNSTSGTLRLEGFQLDYMGTNGLVIGGSTTLTHLNGGQFTNLSNSYASVKVVQVNSTGTIPATASNVGFNWNPVNTTPPSSAAYTILYSSGCANHSMDFAGWFGDWADNVTTFDVTTKINKTNCNLSLGAMSSAVSMLSFKATPYDNKIDLKWETITESDHIGFNVFRDKGDGHLVQLNKTLIRNIFTSGSLRGKYRFIDSSVENDKRYYYYVQDVSFSGLMKMHGPVSAVAKAGLGMPPADQTDESSGGNTGVGDTPPTSGIPNSSYEDLGDGVTILSRSTGNIRLKIVPGTTTYAPSAWNNAYQTASISGYSKQVQIGKPETLVKTILIEVDNKFSAATLEAQSKATTVLNGHLLQPAPAYVLVGNTLQPQYSVDATAYAANSFGTEDFYSVSPQLVSVGERKYLQVIIKPLFQNPAASQIKSLDSATLDISLNGNNWSQKPPVYRELNAAYITDNALAVNYEASGFYELTYDQLEDASVEGPFDGVNINELRLYQQEDEIPIEVISSDGVFNSGDAIRFYVEYMEYAEHTYNTAVLTTVNLFNKSPVRMASIDGNPAGKSAAENGVEIFETTSESNEMALLSAPVGEDQDHFFWQMIYYPVVNGPQDAYKNITVKMPGLASESDSKVNLDLYLKGASGNSLFTRHSLEIYVNNILAPVEQIELEDQESVVKTIQVPSNYFFPGNNTVKIKVTGAFIQAGEYDIVYINKVKAQYPRYRLADSDYLVMKNSDKNKVISFSGFSTAGMNVYDISDYNDIRHVENAAIQLLNGSYQVKFFAGDDNEFLLGRRYALLSDAEFKTVRGLNLISGAESLKDPAQHADYVIIAEKRILPYLNEYIDHKQSQGLVVKAVSLERIYNEFSYGRHSPEAIKEFLNFARTSWATPKLKYALLIGDTSYDPKDYLQFGAAQHKVPQKFVRGMIYDFLSDHWFTTEDSVHHRPNINIGRLPSNDTKLITAYLEKVMAYENGDSAPDLSVNKKLAFFNTKSESLENFEGKVSELKTLESLNKFQTNQISHESVALGTFNQDILDSFNQDNLVLTFMGHGAEDRWAAENGNIHFDNGMASALTNQKLPMVLALNCLNASFQEADESVTSIAEKLVFNADGGAIAFIGSNSMTTSMAQFHFATNFFTSLGQAKSSDSHTTRLGDIFTLTKVGLGDSSYNRDTLYSYHLIGDPTLKLPEEFFNKPSTVVTPHPGKVSKDKSSAKSFGCAAHASDGAPNPWEGMMELVALGIIYILATRLKFR